MIINQRYLVLKELHPSMSSQTYLCSDTSTDDEVFLKLLRAGNDNINIINELFKREVRALEVLNHKNVIRYFDAGEDGKGNHYIVTEYFHSTNLLEYIKQNATDIEGKFDLALQIVDGLIHAHDKDIIHRDLKPQNILVDRDLTLKIVDYGISKIIGLAYNPADTLKDHMSTRYAAPEQLLRQEVTCKSDLYSFGLVLAYIFIESEPSDNRNELPNYINAIEIGGVLDLVRVLTSVDPDERPSGAHRVKSILVREKAAYVSQTQKVNIYCTWKARKKLVSTGLVRNSDTKEAISFINSDIKCDYWGYTRNNKYYFIGERVKYACTISREKDLFTIYDLYVIDDQIDYEREQQKGIKLSATWSIRGDIQVRANQEETERLASSLSDFELQRDQEKKAKTVDSKLINDWRKLLELEYDRLREKEKACHYSNLQINSTGDSISVSIEQINYKLQIGDRVQMTLKENNKPKCVGYYQKNLSDAENKILIQVDADIELDDLPDSGVLGLDTRQERTNLRRFANAMSKLVERDSVNPRLLDILNFPGSVSMSSTKPIEKFFQGVITDTNSASAQAVKKALSTKEAFLLQGPPGTGKTTVIAEIVCQIFDADKDAKILLVSQSNPAVDHAIKGIAQLLTDLCIVRIGRLEKISKTSENLLYANKLDEWVSKTKSASTVGLVDYFEKSININKDEFFSAANLYLADKCADSEESLLNLLNEPDGRVLRILQLVKRWHNHLGKFKEFDELFADNASIVAATCVGIASRNQVNNLVYDWVIVDEAARATPLETLIPIVRGKKFILVGDHKQLPPVVTADLLESEKNLSKADLEKSLFEDLFDNISSSAKFTLTEQFRMHPAISQLISESFYPNDRLTTKLTAADRKHSLRWQDKAIIWLDTGKLSKNTEREIAFSKCNPCEVEVITTLLSEMKVRYNNRRSTSVGIISGYDAQKNMLIDSIQPENSSKWESLQITIDNVDAFQGSEVDVVIYSVVRSNDKRQLGFLYDTRRLNVALSRGRNCLIIVGNYAFIDKANPDGYNPFIPVIRFIAGNKEYAVREVLEND